MIDMLIIPGLWRLRQEDYGIEASLSYKVRPCLNPPTYPLSKQHRTLFYIDLESLHKVLSIDVYLSALGSTPWAPDTLL